MGDEQRCCWQPSSPDQDHPPPHPTHSPGSWRRQEDPSKGARAPKLDGALCQDAGLWPSSCAASLEPVGPSPGSHCFLGSLCATRATGTTVLTRDPRDCPAHVVAPSTTAPTFDRDLLDLPGFLIDPLLSADFLCGAHEFFEFLNLLSTRKQRSCRKREDAKTPCSRLPHGSQEAVFQQ